MGSKINRLRVPLVPDRVRRIAGQGFGFIPHRFLQEGFLSSLNRDELTLYVFLICLTVINCGQTTAKYREA